jgi:hypothetical protein
MTTISDIKGIIYIIENKINNMCYVGQTLSHTFEVKEKIWISSGINERLLKHLYKAKQNVDYELYRDINKYGINNFNIKIEHEIPSIQIDKLDELENITIKRYNTIEKGYNTSNNTSNFCPSKKIIFEYYNIKKNQSAENEKRNKRRKQLTIPYEDRYMFFKNKTIISIKLNPIREGLTVKTVRVIIDVNEFDVYRINFTYKTIQETLKKALDFCREIYNGQNIDIHPSLTRDNTSEFYKYDRRLKECENKEIEKITGNKYFHKLQNNYIYIISIYFKNFNKKRYSFGGKNIDIKDAFVLAKEFVNKLNVSNIICSLNCPQQAAAE